MSRFANNSASKGKVLGATPGLIDRDVTFPLDAQDTISALRWTPTRNNHLAAASWDGNVYVYDVANTTNTSGIRGLAAISANAPFFDCDFNKDGTLVAGVGADMKVHVLDLGSGKTQVWEGEGGHEKPIHNVRFVDVPSAGSHASILATGSWDRTVRYWDMRQPKCIATLSLPERVYAMDTGSSALFVATADSKVQQIDLRANPMAIAKELTPAFKTQITSIACSSDGSRWAAGSIEGRASVTATDDKNKSKIDLSWKCHRETLPEVKGKLEVKVWAVNAVCLLPVNNSVVATAGSDGTFSFWNTDKRQRLKGFPSVGGAITAATFSQDSASFVYAVGYDWAQGYRGSTAGYPNKLVVHPVLKEEVGMTL